VNKTVTQEKLSVATAALQDVETTLTKMLRCIGTARTEYKVATGTKTVAKHLPQADVDSLYGEYATLKKELQEKIAALP